MNIEHLHYRWGKKTGRNTGKSTDMLVELIQNSDFLEEEKTCVILHPTFLHAKNNFDLCIKILQDMEYPYQVTTSQIVVQVGNLKLEFHTDQGSKQIRGRKIARIYMDELEES